ncbi:SusC/RagA family TonB-linked outer membrane protein [Rudanella paleaurantiibacter]|uniref:SusC/RagA family TonB-linked outer membrane protein n=1 Tax=Rudanella paleaurantiibacter TaxID=2614655 RepID=A0A7J5TT86_9BACT|nr:TonB-dependent receptor [Rudanella paleaurantiibacter]KAB7726851.1 SusC/RagA family TonB-linked outer membrane protein [Rudanella paleaurantiibacter]
MKSNCTLVQRGWNLGNRSVRALLLLIGMALAVTSAAFAQSSIRITGSVVSAADGQSIPGASVTVKGTTLGTVTGADGSFSISVPSRESVLQVSNIGFTALEVPIGNQTQLKVSLQEDVALLGEVVVVGYGEQKKINLTGAVETIRFDGAVNLPVTNTSQMMYGRFSGVQLTQSSGLPGADGSSINIRGIGTFGNSNPLVVIDNIQYNGLTEFNNLAPSDIESISVLKDASASAIYGARGANGVIVVTTKKGKKGKLTVDYNGYTGIQRVTVVPEYLDANNYALLRNERDRNANGANAPLRYSAADLEAIRTGSQPDQYANTNWARETLRDAPIQNHYLSFSGGTDNLTYRVSLGYLNQNAIVRGKFKSDRYTLGLNLTAKANQWLTLTNVTNAYWSKFRGPAGGADAITGETGIINQFQRSSPTIPAYYANGAFGIVDGAYQKVNFSFPSTNPLLTGILGDNKQDNINISERIGLSANILRGLTFETSGSLVMNVQNISNFNPTLTTRDWAGQVVNQSLLNSLTNTFNFNYRLLNENILRYSTSWNQAHNLQLMAGHSVIYDKDDGFAGSLQGFPSDNIQEFNGGGVTNPSVSGAASEVAWQSFFGRVNYNYMEKYLLELNLRRDGSSKFGQSKRYGTFPSMSVGWNLTREPFMQSLNWVSNFKLRSSWGISGNDRIGNYIYEQTYNTGLDYFLGDAVVGAVALTSLANPNITWETIRQLNVGLDLELFQNRLYFSADYFRRNSTDILYTNFPVPNSLGVTNLAAQNAAGMLNRGLELTANYSNNFGGLKLNLGANVTRMADNEVTSLGPGGEETISGNSIIRIGQPFNAYYGYRVLGVFQTKEEVAGAPVQFGSPLTAPGDLRYADVSGANGTPDGKIDAFDRVVIGNPFPRLIYNFNANMTYRGFDFTILFQGLDRVDRVLNGNGQLPMADDRNNALSYWLNRWTPENPSTELPRLGGVNNTVLSSFYIQDASFLRLKNLELGYTVPVQLSSKAGIRKLRVYASGQNILTFTKLKNFDPERTSGGNSDRLTPLYKIYSLGLNLKF